ncbi:MAG: tetraacyldisaccharide 4'-kinase [Flavobacterium sp.]|uniref:tetraacyldisaccharide 4'-kinase n=1 Tax=Flavobacterium sp. TaxID=239 RepID=UPI0012076AB9|nr:tetraacyldisaccharide 4'-kinase [Flavobacterium sp.]RZJ67092.1 MAG: tetraacyldisaccharide 4'-kinase [Flavobacterium sp.]
MVLLRKILFPFAAIYGFITGMRNYFYDKGIFRSTTFNIPVIAVGNLSVGGTGKSPQIEYLLRLLTPNYKVATLSRGYKRKTSGFVLADKSSNAETLGDEPFQFHRKFPDILVAVDADRTNGIQKLLEQPRKPDVILLDDAFQHRKVHAGFYILLTVFNDLYVDDFLLPTGNLRESRRGAKRADIIIVTKCPSDLSEAQQNVIRYKMRLKSHQQLFFSFIDYDDSVCSDVRNISVDELKNQKKLLVAGIAKPKPFFDYLNSGSDEILEFPDHHHFSDSDILEIAKKANGNPIVTTEKDYVRLQNSGLENVYYLPIKSTLTSGADQFDKTILDYVGKSTTDR